MFYEQVSPNLAFMDKAEDIADPELQKAHWEKYHEYVAAGVKVALIDGGENKAKAAAEEWKKKRAKKGKGKSRRGGDNKLTCFTMATELASEHFSDWSAAELNALTDLGQFCEVLVARLENSGSEVAEFYGILHDNDTREVWSSAEQAYIREPKFLHAHVVCKFSGRDKGLTLSDVAKALGVEENMIEKPKSGRYSYDNMLAYLIHAKDKDKFQYPPEKVLTVRGPDYMDVWAEHKRAWDRGSSVKAKKDAIESVDLLVDLARNGKVCKQQILLSDELYGIYSIPSNKKQVDAALQAYAERRMAQAVSAMEAGEFSTSIFFFYGRPGTGKSNLIKSICRYWKSVNGWETASLAASNAMDEYSGEEIILLDDVRGGAMSAEDWLKLLDPYNANAASSRYKNKAGVAPRVIIISANKDPLEFFYYSRNIGGGDRSEMVDTFFRRLQWYVTVLNPYDFGMHNCIVKVPVRCAPYDVTFGSEEEEPKKLSNLTFRFDDAVEDTWFSSFGLADFIVRAVDSCSGGQIESRTDAEALFSSVQDCVFTGRLPAVRAGKLPALPAPDGSVPQSVNMRSVYETIFTPLWQSVFASELASGKKRKEAMASFEEWKERGCNDSWDRERGFYKSLPSPEENSNEKEVVHLEEEKEGVEG